MTITLMQMFLSMIAGALIGLFAWRKKRMFIEQRIMLMIVCAFAGPIVLIILAVIIVSWLSNPS